MIYDNKYDITSHVYNMYSIYILYGSWLNILLYVHTYYISHITLTITLLAGQTMLIFISFYSSVPTTLFLRVLAGLSLKELNISMGRGKMMVEFFSAEMLLSV